MAGEFDMNLVVVARHEQPLNLRRRARLLSTGLTDGVKRAPASTVLRADDPLNGKTGAAPG